MLRENTQGGLGGGGWGVGGRPKFQILFTENPTGNCNLHCGTARGVKAYCLAGQCFTMWDRGSQIKLWKTVELSSLKRSQSLLVPEASEASEGDFVFLCEV